MNRSLSILTGVKALFYIVILLLLIPTLAQAELPVSGSPKLVLPYAQLWAVLVGVVTPLFAYVVNSKFWKDAPEQVKALVQTLISVVASAVYVAAATPTFGWNDQTLQLIVTTVIAGFASHSLIYRPTGVNVSLGAKPHLVTGPPGPTGPVR